MQPTSKNGFASHVKPASSRNNRGGGAVRIPDTIFQTAKDNLVVAVIASQRVASLVAKTVIRIETVITGLDPRLSGS
jgi:hypothetical protein